MGAHGEIPEKSLEILKNAPNPKKCAKSRFQSIAHEDLSGGQINDPSSGKHYSLPFLPETPSSLSRTLDSPRALLPELQRYKDTVGCAALGAEVPGHRHPQLTQTLIVRLLKTHFCTSILDFEKSTE